MLYVCGFQFNTDGTLVTLIRKKRPHWQAGLLNGVGGHIDAGETPAQAMRREFREEAGVDIPEGEWREFCVLTHNQAIIYFFETRNNIEPESKTDEVVGRYLTASVLNWQHRVQLRTMLNLSWLIPLALSESQEVANVFDESPTG